MALNIPEPRKIDDWQTLDVSFTTVRPLPLVDMPKAGTVVLPGAARLDGHATLRARARLSTEALAGRDLAPARLSRLLTDDPRVCVPFPIATPPGRNPSLSVLELTDLNDPALVTPDAPLRLTVAVALPAHEQILVVAFDGEFFLPVGRIERRAGSELTIVIDRLPTPLPSTRSLAGSVALFFEKVTAPAHGHPLPSLRAVSGSGSGAGPVVGPNIEAIHTRLSRAVRVLLIVPGPPGYLLRTAPGLPFDETSQRGTSQESYDIIIVFEYDAWDTGIAEAGRLLKQSLEAVRPGAGHGKPLDIVAHSTGGLVARWFVEREGGNRITSRVTLLGTPNGGSPWVASPEWARLALAMGLNELSTRPWPASALPALVALCDAPASSRLASEVAPGAKLIGTLNASPDPGIPYVIVEGLLGVQPWLEPLSGRPTTESSAYFSFLRDGPTDLAVSAASQRAIPPGRSPQPKFTIVTNDHLSY